MGNCIYLLKVLGVFMIKMAHERAMKRYNNDKMALERAMKRILYSECPQTDYSLGLGGGSNRGGRSFLGCDRHF